MSNSPHPGGSRRDVNRDEPNKTGGTSRGNQGQDRNHGDMVGAGTFGDQRDRDVEGLVRGPPPKPHKRYSQAG